MDRKYSNPFPLVHCPSLCCKSRAVTSHAIVYPNTYSIAPFNGHPAAFLPMTIANSASCSTCWDCGGRMIASPMGKRAEGGLRKVRGPLVWVRSSPGHAQGSCVRRLKSCWVGREPITLLGKARIPVQNAEIRQTDPLGCGRLYLHKSSHILGVCILFRSE